MGSFNQRDDMNLNNLYLYMRSWGKLLKDSEVQSFNRYVSKMLLRNRVIIVNGEHGMEAILFYFLTDDANKFNNRPMWSTPEDSNTGHIIFIDKMIAHNWTKSLRLAVESAIEKKYPFIDEAYWLREPKNRSVIIKRRRTHELHSQVC